MSRLQLEMLKKENIYNPPSNNVTFYESVGTSRKSKPSTYVKK